MLDLCYRKKIWHLKFYALILIINILYYFTPSVWAQTEMRTQSTQVDIYRDTNGYFAAVPPIDWSRKDFPLETVRSKVSFHHPRDTDVGILIIAGPTPTQSYTLDDLYKENKAKLDNPPPPLQGGTFKIKKGEMGVYQTVIQNISKTNMFESEVVSLVNKGIFYTINFTTRTKSQKANLTVTIRHFRSFLKIFSFWKQAENFQMRRLQKVLLHVISV